MNHNDVSHAGQHRGPTVGDLHTAPEGQMQRNPPADMGRRSSGSELLDWPSELEPPPLPAVTRRRARRTDDRGDCGPHRVGGEFAVRKSALTTTECEAAWRRRPVYPAGPVFRMAIFTSPRRKGGERNHPSPTSFCYTPPLDTMPYACYTDLSLAASADHRYSAGS